MEGWPIKPFVCLRHQVRSHLLEWVKFGKFIAFQTMKVHSKKKGQVEQSSKKKKIEHRFAQEKNVKGILDFSFFFSASLLHSFSNGRMLRKGGSNPSFLIFGRYFCLLWAIFVIFFFVFEMMENPLSEIRSSFAFKWANIEKKTV